MDTYGHDLQNFLDPRTDSGSIADEMLRTRTDADPIPSISRQEFRFFITAIKTLQSYN